MEKRKLFIRITCIVLAGLMILGLITAALGSNAYADSASIQAEIDSLNSKKSDIQARMDEIQSEIDSLDFEKATVLEKKELLDKKNTLAQQELDVITEQIGIIDGLISNMQLDLDNARNEENAQRERWLTRVRAMEEGSNLGYIDVVFNATSFSDLLTRIDLVNEVMTYDEQLEADYIAAREHTEAVKAEYEAYKAELEVKQEDLRAEQEQLQEEIDEAIAYVEQIEEEVKNNEELAEELRKQQQAVQDSINAKVAELEAERKPKEEEERQRRQQEGGGSSGGSSSGSTVTGTGSWGWPCPSSKYITSRAGNRFHPIFNEWRYHSGIDIAANTGAAVVASDSGTVCLCGVNGGYGNCIMIDHGNGYYTLYGHLSGYATSDGATVKKGQTIGYVGSTGWATGPHLHFEIRKGSVCLDPESAGGFTGLTYAPDAGE